MEQGKTAFRYERWLDLRTTPSGLPAILFFRSKRSGRHKLQLIEVATLGFTRTVQIVEEVFELLDRVRIVRIDICADFCNQNAVSFAQNVYVHRSQNFQIFKNRSGVSYYPRRSPLRTVLIYDRRRFPKKPVYQRPDFDVTRFEVQLKGASVPIREFTKLKQYADTDVISDLQVRKLITRFDPKRPNQFLAATGFRSLVKRYGLDATLKFFPSPYRAYLKQKFLRRSSADDLEVIRNRIRKTTLEWMRDILRFPRTRKGSSDEAS
jgi:hypothetical protein